MQLLPKSEQIEQRCISREMFSRCLGRSIFYEQWAMRRVGILKLNEGSASIGLQQLTLKFEFPNTEHLFFNLLILYSRSKSRIIKTTNEIKKHILSFFSSKI